MGRVLWRINENEFVTPIESPWFGLHMLRAVIAGALSWDAFEEGYTTLGVVAAVWVVGEIATSVEIKDRRLP